MNTTYSHEKPPKEGTLVYRPDIDGLRAIAVGLVIAYHFGIPPMTGGFIGVDVFFVISGFLITSLLSTTRKILVEIPKFYARRAKRLMPAFILVFVVTSVVAGIVMLPHDLSRYLKSASSAFAFNSNIFFSDEARDYFAANAHEMPLLHTWSLSIEWQFYLIFPAAFLAANSLLSRKVITLLLLGITVVLAGYSIELTAGQEAYFSTAARFFELMIGALVSRLELKAPEKIQQLVVAGGVFGITALAVLFTPTSPFPGFNALVVCLATGLILLCGRNNQLLSSPWLVHVGKISYSAYLWHWPVVAFMAYLHLETSVALRLFLVAIVLLLADQTYRYVERPGKNLRLGFFASAIVLCLVPILVARGAYLLSWKNEGFPMRLGTEASEIYSTIAGYTKNPAHNCTDDSAKGLLAACEFGGNDKASILYVIGDSHAKSHPWLADVLTKDTGLRVMLRSYGGCLMIPDIVHAYGSAGDTSRCRNAATAEYKEISAVHPKYVVLIQRWNNYYPLDEISRLPLAIERIIASGSIPVIVGQSAEDGTDMFECSFEHIKLRQKKQTECVLTRAAEEAKTNIKSVEKIFAELRSRYPSLIFIDLQAAQCEDGKCAGEIDGVPIYDDSHHLNSFGSAKLAEAYRKRFGTPFLP